MKNRFFLSFLVLFHCLAAIAQNYEEQGETRYGYTPVRQGNYWGVIDKPSR